MNHDLPYQWCGRFATDDRLTTALCSLRFAAKASAERGTQRGSGMDVNGVAAVVTGAASGLGEATARELAKRGAKVAVFDRDADRGTKIAGEIGGIFCEVDVTSAEKVIAAFARAREA